MPLDSEPNEVRPDIIASLRARENVVKLQPYDLTAEDTFLAAVCMEQPKKIGVTDARGGPGVTAIGYVV